MRKKYIGTDILKLEHWQNLETNRSGYLRGLAYACVLRPDDDRAAHYLAREKLWTGRPRSALKEFDRHVSMNRWPTEKAQSLIFMGEAYMQLGNEDLAIECWHKAYDIEPGRREPLIKLAQFYFQKNDPQRTAAYASAALTIPMGNFYANDTSHYRHVPHELLYWAFFYLGKKDEAREHFLKAVSYAPDHPKYLFESQFFVDLPTVSFVIPTLGRPEGLKKCLDSIEKLNYPKELIDIQVLAEPEPTVPQKVKQGVDNSKGEVICYVANDTEMSPDSLKIAVLSSLASKKGLVAFHSEAVYPDEGNICCHFVIRRDLVPKLDGEVFCTRINHMGVDNLLWAKCKKLNEAHHESKALITHNHYSKGAEFDWVYQRATSRTEEDRAILREELAKL